MNIKRWQGAGLAGLVLLLPSALPLGAQSVSCSGVSAWVATTTYAAGAKVTYQGGLYQAQTSTTNVPPNYCPSCGWWQSLGTCGTVATCTSAPSVPGGLASSNITSSALNLSWGASSAGTNCTVSYNVYRNGTQVATGLTGTSTSLSGLAANTSYSFTVAAVDAAGASAQSSALSVTTASSGCTAAPSVPTGLGTSGVTSSSVKLSWSASSVGSGCSATYTVFRNGSQVASGLTSTSTTISGLSASTAYTFAVAAADAAGSSAQSQAVTITTANPSVVADPTAGTPYFMIVNKFSGKALDLIGGDTSNGARINQWSFDYNGANQRWAILPTEGGNHFKLISFVSGKCACIAGDSMDSGAQLHSWDYVGNNPGQQFDLVDVGNGWFKIRNVKSGKILDDDAFGTGNDNKVQQWDDGNTDNQLWRLQPWGDYFIRAAGGRYICVQGRGNADGNRIIQYDKEDNAWFKWRFLSEGDGWLGCFSLNALSKVLCVAGPSTQPGQYCHLWEYNPSNIGDQKLRVMPQTDGTFKFYFQFDGQTWDIPGGQTGNNVELDQYPENGAAWQKFAMERVPGQNAVTGATITTQPSNQKVTTGSTATFWVSATSSSPISYQWKRNGAAINGATSAIYTTPVTTSADNGATFTATLSSGGTVTTSVTVTLTINTDIDDLMARASGRSWSSATPMGGHFQGLHVTTDSDRNYLNDASYQPPVPPGLVSELHLKSFPVTLFPSGAPSPTDINQHNIGDCNGITAMGAMAYMVPNFVKALITDNGGGVFTVAMFDPQGKPVTVKVDSQFLADGSGNLAAVSGKNGKATWSTVLEKAVMKYNVIYQADSTIEGIGSENVTPLFTGVGNSFAFDRGALSPDEITRVIKASLSCGKFISGGYGAQITLGNIYSVTGHGYACYWPASGSMIAMRNPWGVNPIINGGGYDSSTDGVLNIPSSTTWSQTIDLRIIDSGIAGTAGRTTPYAPPPTLMQSLAPEPIRLSPRVLSGAASK